MLVICWAQNFKFWWSKYSYCLWMFWFCLQKHGYVEFHKLIIRFACFSSTKITFSFRLVFLSSFSFSLPCSANICNETNYHFTSFNNIQKVLSISYFCRILADRFIIKTNIALSTSSLSASSFSNINSACLYEFGRRKNYKVNMKYVKCTSLAQLTVWFEGRKPAFAKTKILLFVG